MKTKEILKGLIEHLSAFEAENQSEQNLTLNDFVGYLNTQLNDSIIERNISGENAPAVVNEMGEETHSVIARLVIIMNRYAKSYIKKALEGSKIQTGEEFSYLIILLTFESLTKTELINKNIMEKTSGVEIIKRLLSLGLIQEADDTKDKRSKRVSITPSGRNELMAVLPKMHQVTNLVAGNLSKQEQATMAYLLKKLDHYHHGIFNDDRLSNFDQLSLKYLSDQ
jgi:DNA-binding MarR family transcriptional regulator